MLITLCLTVYLPLMKAHESLYFLQRLLISNTLKKINPIRRSMLHFYCTCIFLEVKLITANVHQNKTFVSLQSGKTPSQFGMVPFFHDV